MIPQIRLRRFGRTSASGGNVHAIHILPHVKMKQNCVLARQRTAGQFGFDWLRYSMRKRETPGWRACQKLSCLSELLFSSPAWRVLSTTFFVTGLADTFSGNSAPFFMHIILLEYISVPIIMLQYFKHGSHEIVS